MKTDNELIDDFYVEHGGEKTLAADLSFYESDWNLLMDVVEKIRNMDPSLFNYNVKEMTEFRMWISQIQALSIFTPIDKVYAVLVNFIKWYNSTKL